MKRRNVIERFVVGDLPDWVLRFDEAEWADKVTTPMPEGAWYGERLWVMGEAHRLWRETRNRWLADHGLIDQSSVRPLPAVRRALADETRRRWPVVREVVS